VVEAVEVGGYTCGLDAYDVQLGCNGTFESLCRSPVPAVAFRGLKV
jgi:hypothetical protein